MPSLGITFLCGETDGGQFSGVDTAIIISRANCGPREEISAVRNRASVHRRSLQSSPSPVLAWVVWARDRGFDLWTAAIGGENASAKGLCLAELQVGHRLGLRIPGTTVSNPRTAEQGRHISAPP